MAEKKLDPQRDNSYSKTNFKDNCKGNIENYLLS